MEMDARLTADVLENLLKHSKFNIVIRNAIENAVRHLKEKPEWISCDDELPPDGVTVITLIFGTDVIIPQNCETLEDAIRRTSKYKRTSAGFYGEDGWYSLDGYQEIIAPSYWMAIPKPPEGVTE
jgi:hypothetical protein